MHSRWNSTIGQLNNKLKVAKIPMLISKMNNLKPWNCEWLHNAWKKLKNKQIMILKG